MSNNEYSRMHTKSVVAHVEGETLVLDGAVHLEGKSLVIDGANFLGKDIDYTDSTAVKKLATSAVHTADGFYQVVKENCCTSNPDISYEAHFEMYLAISSLACEIYMKAILYNENLHNGRQVRGHKLDELFNNLPGIIKTKITSEISNIEGILPEIKDMFTTLRYDFEQNHIQGDYLIIFEFMETLRAIAHTYPQDKPSAIKYAKGCMTFE